VVIGQSPISFLSLLHGFCDCTESMHCYLVVDFFFVFLLIEVVFLLQPKSSKHHFAIVGVVGESVMFRCFIWCKSVFCVVDVVDIIVLQVENTGVDWWLCMYLDASFGVSYIYIYMSYVYICIVCGTV